MNSRLPLLKGLLTHSNKEKISFHMPGHKGKILDDFIPLLDNLYALDVTELSDTDDLYNPSGIIKQSLENLTRDRKSKSSIYLTNGSTMGIIATIMALIEPEDIVVMEKNCHKSVYNGCDLAKAKIIPLENKDQYTPVDENTIIETLNNNTHCKMVVISRPNYFGICGSIKSLCDYCRDNNIYLLVDESHGSHFLYSDLLPQSAMELGAGISVNSFHKTLPSITQTSVLNIGHTISSLDQSKILAMVEMLQSSSPSYIMMASMEIATDYMIQQGIKKLENLYHTIEGFYRELENIPWLEKITLPNNTKQDFTRLVLKSQHPTARVKNLLEEKGIFIEMITSDSLVLIGSVVDSKNDYDILLNAFKDMNIEEKSILPEKQIAETQKYQDGWLVPIEKCQGYQLMENIIIYPPGSITFSKDTILTEDNISFLLNAIEKGLTVNTSHAKKKGLLYVKG